MKKSSFNEIERHAPNHSLQRTAPHVTAAASGLRLSAPMQAPRRAPRSLSLGSLGQRYDPGTAAVALEDGRLIELRSVGAVFTSRLCLSTTRRNSRSIVLKAS